MAIIKETIPVHKHFLIIDSPVPFTLVANNGTDEVYRMAGAWRIDLWKILTKDYFKQYPVFTLDLVYDDTNLGGKTIEVRQSDIDLGEGIAGVNGQDVHITNFNDLDLSGLATETTLQTRATEQTLQDIYNYLPNLEKKKVLKFKKFTISNVAGQSEIDIAELVAFLDTLSVDANGGKFIFISDIGLHSLYMDNATFNDREYIQNGKWYFKHGYNGQYIFDFSCLYRGINDNEYKVYYFTNSAVETTYSEVATPGSIVNIFYYDYE